jgi:hypothetical protein
VKKFVKSINRPNNETKLQEEIIMSCFKNILSIVLLIPFINAYAEEFPTFENNTLNIPTVNTPGTLSQYEQVQLKLASDGRWDLIHYREGIAATVETVSVKILESFPVQVVLTATGYMPNGCCTLKTPDTIRDGNQFHVVIHMNELQTFAVCTQALVPFEIDVPLDVYGLDAGQYNVDVNGVTTTFELSVDNKLP